MDLNLLSKIIVHVHDTARSRTQEAQLVTNLHTLEQRQREGVKYTVCEFVTK